MAGSPWICPRCATATNVDNCPNCFHERPTAANYNPPGSIFSITQGPQGYTGLPSSWRWAMILLVFGPGIVVATLALLHK